MCDMPEPCKFPSLDSCQRKILCTHKVVDLAPHPLVGLVLQVGDAEKFPHAAGFESLDPFLRVRCRGVLNVCSAAVVNTERRIGMFCGRVVVSTLFGIEGYGM